MIQKIAVLAALIFTTATLSAFAQPYNFSSVAALNSTASTDSGNSQLSVRVASANVTGEMIAVWSSNVNIGGTVGTDYDIAYATSTDWGATWTAAAILNTNASTDSGDDWIPVIQTDNGNNWIVVWRTGDSLGSTIGTDWDIVYSISTDSGLTWSAPQVVNNYAASDIEQDAGSGLDFLTDRNGVWITVWSSTNTLGGSVGADDDMLFSRSTDNGASWSNAAPICSDFTSDGPTLLEQAPTLATDGGGNWLCTWGSQENSIHTAIGTDYDILASQSSDNGLTWGASAVVNSYAATDTGNDYGDVSVETNGTGLWIAAWYSEHDVSGSGTDFDIVYARSTDNGGSWTSPALLNSNATGAATTDAGPVIDYDPVMQHWLVGWFSTDSLGGTIGSDYDVMVSRSLDNGDSWSALQALSSNAAVDPIGSAEYDLNVEYVGSGRWFTAWRSADSLGGTIDTDEDILYSVTSDLPVEISTLELE